MNVYRTPLLTVLIALLLVSVGFGIGRVTSGSANPGPLLPAGRELDASSVSCGTPDGSPNKLVVVTYKLGGGSGVCAVGGSFYQDVTAGQKPNLGVFIVMMEGLLSSVPQGGQNGLSTLHKLGIPHRLGRPIMAEFLRLGAEGKSLAQVQMEMPHWAEAHRGLFHFTPA